MKESVSYHLYWFLLLIAAFIISLSISWVLLAGVNFAYPLLHDYTGIKENIDLHGPRNRIKPDFDQTSRAERIRLFDGIVRSIPLQGEGLEELIYHTKSGKEIRFLTAAEVVHLKDVAALYAKLKQGVFMALFIWLGLMVVRFRWRIMMPKASVLLGYASLLPMIVVIVYVAGAEKVFYKLHTLVFPAGHQWFFYYEESLMSMMMNAPDMFAYIAVMLVVLAFLITVAMFWVTRYIPLINKTYWESPRPD